MNASVRTVLLVEDAEDCAGILLVALHGIADVEVEHVTTAEAALKKLRHGQVAALITDIQLPGMSGLELAQQFRSVPVIVVSASVDPEAEAKALSAGASAYFTKPFSPGEIRRKMEELLKE